MRHFEQKGNSQYINKINKIRILNLIREKGPLSRADIAKQSGISAPTVTRIAESLIKEEGLIKEVGIGISTGGRKPTLLEFAANDSLVLGIDLGTTHIDGVLANLNAESIAEIVIETKIDEGFEKIMDRIANLISQLSNHPKVQGKKIFGVGLAVAGLINRYQNVIEFSPDFHWEDVDIKKTLNEKFNFEIKFDNVTRVMALGELWYGIGQQVKNFIVINIGYGIGAGIIINGQPLYGSFGLAGEFGHMIMDKDSKMRCECGSFGCLESLASGRAIAQSALQQITDGRISVLKEKVNGDLLKITTKMVAEAARNGDQLSKEIFENAVEYLGISITNLINLLTPEVILIGGGVAQADDLLFAKIQEIVNKRALRTRSRKILLKPVTFGMKAASKGAVALILNEVLNLEFSKNSLN